MTTDLFNAGFRPAIDSGLSVSRVGGNAQTKAMKQVAKSLKIELANFQEMKSFSQFGSDLDKATVQVLKHGEVLMRVLTQKQYEPKSMEHEVFDLFAAHHGYFDNVEYNKVRSLMDQAYDTIHTMAPDIFDEIASKKEISKENEEALKKLLEEFMKGFAN